jgi:hypothetical protein
MNKEQGRAEIQRLNYHIRHLRKSPWYKDVEEIKAAWWCERCCVILEVDELDSDGRHDECGAKPVYITVSPEADEEVSR